MARAHLGSVVRRLRLLLTRPDADSRADGVLLQRFVAGGEAEAFEALVRRHGSLVRGVCRRVLRDEHDADDAFQATFLVLARKAAAVRKSQSLAGYLHAVAFRVALKARAQAARRQAVEQRAAEERSREVAAEPTLLDLRVVLDEELARLPEKFRAPLVLCYLEGKTRDEAAQELGWPAGTVAGRLAQARELLRGRLTRRGLAFSAALFVTLLSEASAPAALSSAVVDSTVRTAGAAPAAVPGPIQQLAEGVLRDMTLIKIKAGAVVCLLTGALTAGAGLFLAGAAAEKPIELAAAVAQSDAAKATGLKPGEVRRLKHTGVVNVVMFSPSLKSPLLATQDLNDGFATTIRLWDMAANKEIRLGRGPVSAAQFAFSPDGKLLAAFGGLRSGGAGMPNVAGVQFWDIATRRERRPWIMKPTTVNYPGGGRVTSGGVVGVSLSPDGKIVALADGGPTEEVRLIDLASGKDVRRLGAPGKDAREKKGFYASPVNDAVFSPDGKLVAGPHVAASVLLWGAATGRLVRVLNPPRDGEMIPADGLYRIQGLGFSADGGTLFGRAMGVGNRTEPVAKKEIRFWDVTTGKEIRRIPIARQSPEGQVWDIMSFAVSPDARFVALPVPGDRAAVQVIEVASGLERIRLDNQKTFGYQSLAFSPDGNLLAGSGIKAAIVWDLRLAPSPALSARDLAPWWADLASGDGHKVHAAVWALASLPGVAEPFLQERLREITKVDEAAVKKQIVDLDSNDFPVRQRAAQELEKRGDAVIPLLQQAVAAKPSAEKRRRLEQILDAVEKQPTPELLRGLRAVEVLERLGTPAASESLDAIAKGTPESRLTRDAKAALRRMETHPVRK